MAAAEPDANTHNADGKSLSLRRSRSDPKTLLAYIIYPATAKGGRAGRSVVFMVTTDTLRDRQRPAAMFISLCLISSAPPHTTTTISSSRMIKYICTYVSSSNASTSFGHGTREKALITVHIYILYSFRHIRSLTFSLHGTDRV